MHVPQPPVEACIALSIVFVAREIARSREGAPGLTERWPWVISFTFGLLHGFGFAGALSEVGLPQVAIPVALLFFNVGVEIGQLLFIAAVVAALVFGRRAMGRLRPTTFAYLRSSTFARLVPTVRDRQRSDVLGHPTDRRVLKRTQPMAAGPKISGHIRAIAPDGTIHRGSLGLS